MRLDNNNKIYSDYSKVINSNNEKEIKGYFSDILNSKISDNKSTNIEEIFNKASEKYSIPVNLLKAVAQTESNFNSNAQSKAGAQGIMQLMPSTARGLGVTDSFDTEQNIMGGAKYLSQMLNKFDGKIDLALAAYNAGPGNVEKYNGIPPFKETQNYINKIMGLCDQTIDISSSNSFEVNSNQLDEMILNTNFLDIFSDGNISNDELEFIINAYKNNIEL